MKIVKKFVPKSILTVVVSLSLALVSCTGSKDDATKGPSTEPVEVHISRVDIKEMVDNYESRRGDLCALIDDREAVKMLGDNPGKDSRRGVHGAYGPGVARYKHESVEIAFQCFFRTENGPIFDLRDHHKVKPGWMQVKDVVAEVQQNSEWPTVSLDWLPDFPGVAFGDEDQVLALYCGSRLLKYQLVKQEVPTEATRKLKEDVQIIMKALVEAACGTKDDPTDAVTGFPERVNALYHGFGGANPKDIEGVPFIPAADIPMVETTRKTATAKPTE